MNTSLSTLSRIQSAVRPATDGFSFVKTLHSFVNNLQFGEGYKAFLAGSDTPQSYVWKCLSAVGDDVGELIYANVAGYVDYASNVDICKIKSLRSMMKELGFDYTIFDNIEQIPAEILDLMDILSINRKYLLGSKRLTDAFDAEISAVRPKYVKDDFAQALSGRYNDPDEQGVMHSSDDAAEYRYRYFQNSFTVGAGSLSSVGDIQVSALSGVYSLSVDNGYSVPPSLSGTGDMVVSREYRNRHGCAIKRFAFSDEYVNVANAYISNHNNSSLPRDSADWQENLMYWYGLFFRGQAGIDELIGIANEAAFQDAVTPRIDGSWCSVDAFFDSSSPYTNSYESLSAFCLTNNPYNNYTSSYIDLPFLVKYDGVGAAYDPDYVDDDTYRCFVEQVYLNALSGFLTMTFQDAGNTTADGEPLPETPVAAEVYRTVEYNPLSGSAYGNIQENYQRSIDRAAAVVRRIKDSNNIPITFDENGIVDAIENGLDGLDNYAGAKRRLLEFVIAERTKPYNSDVSARVQLDDTNASVQQVTRYAYYKKMKVLEIAKFVDNKYYTDTYGSLSGRFVYNFDTNYNEIRDGQGSVKNCISMDDDGKLVIDGKMLESVARSLADTTFYVTKLRDKMKIQARKNYMKGTNNLLTYVVNEFLVDYSRMNRKIFEADALDGDPALRSAVDGIRASLSAHSVNDIAVNEYYDMTDYFNISTEYSAKALADGGFKNPAARFWQDGSAQEDGLQFGLDEIDRFYLSTLNVADGRNQFRHAIEFLSGIYDVGANKSYLSPALSGMFTTRLSTGADASGRTTFRDSDDMYGELRTLSGNYGDFMLFLSATPPYEYDRSQTVQEQIDGVFQYIRDGLSADWCDSISVLHDAYVKDVELLSVDFDRLKGQLDDFLSGEYSFYYEKSKNKYCYVNHDVNGVYGPDYYIGNPSYAYRYYIENLEGVTKFTNRDENIRNYPILCTVGWLDEQFDMLCADFYEQVVNPEDQDHPGIESWGWVDVNALTLDDEFDNAKSFLDGKISQRLAYLQSVVDALRVQANELQSHYQSVKNTFNASVAAYKNQYLDVMGEVYPDYTLTSNAPGYPYTNVGDEDDYAYTDFYNNAKKYYSAKEDDDGNLKGKYDRGSNTAMDCTPSESDSLEDLVVKFSTWVSQGTGGKITCQQVKEEGEDPYWEEIDRVVYTKYMDAGVQSAITNTQASLREIDATYDSIIGQLKALGYDGPDVVADRKTNIDNLIQYVTVELDESRFELDDKVQAYKGYIRRVVQLSARYLPVKDEYLGIRGDSTQARYLLDYMFHQEFTKGNMQGLCTFTMDKDAENKKTIIGQLSTFGDTYYGYVDAYMEIGRRLEDDSRDDPVKIKLEETEFVIGEHEPIVNTLASISEYRVNTDVFEMQLDDISKYLVQNVEEKYNAAIDWVEEISYRISNDSPVEPGFLNLVSAEISADLSSTGVTLDEVVKAKLSSLNFFEHSDYRTKRDMFLTYSGLSAGYDPYYNHKNQIHSSYQIHPYLWNFMLTTYDVNPIAVAFDRLALDDLEDRNVALKYGEYYGQYGEVLSVAGHNLVDSTGYVTRYEHSAHRHEGIYGECVDYDGAFYPPALDMYMANPDAAAQSVGSGSGEFYDRFYAHLRLTEAERAEISGQLLAYRQKIEGIVLARTELSDVCDIFQYGLDADENAYILYKRYSQPSPTYQEKKNTRGQLWVRKNDHPIAFPAFFAEPGSDETPNVAYRVDPKDPQSELLLNSRIAALDPSMPDAFYDFRITDGGGGMLLVAVQRGDQSPDAYTDPRGCDSAEAVISRISYEYDDGLKKTVLKLNNDKVGSDRMYISNFNDEKYNNEDAMLRYVGAFSKDSNSMEIIGLYRNPDGTIYQDLSGRVHGRRFEWYPGGETKSFALQANPGHKVVGKDAVIAFQSQGKAVLQMAFVVDTEEQYTKLSSYTEQVLEDPAAASDGPVKYDPTESEMNSFDSFGQKVAIVTFDKNGVDKGCPAVYDMNADMSYLPVYPQRHGVAEVWRTTAAGDEFKSVELLGMSKDIGGAIAMVNPDPDPNFDYESILSNYTFGRVYEDFVQSMDKSFVKFSNPLLNNWSTESTPDGEFIVWSSNIQSKLEQAMGRYVNPFNPALPEYSDRDVDRLRLVVYNRECLGKNPYFVCDLGDIAVEDPSRWTSAYYMPDSASSGKTAVETDNGARIVVGGIPDQAGNVTDVLTNRIRNIEGIRANFTKADRTLRIGFRVADGKEPGSVFVARGSIDVALYSDKDMSLFRYYHMLDAYGAVCSQYHRNYLTDYYEIHEPPGWAVFKDISRFPDDYFLPSYKSCYFRDSDGSLTLHDGSYEASHPVVKASLHDWVRYEGEPYKYETSVYLREWYFPTTKEGDPFNYHSAEVSVDTWMRHSGSALPAARYKGNSVTDPLSEQGVTLSAYLYGTTAYEHPLLSDQAYVKDRTIYLKDLRLEDYDFLSDVYVLGVGADESAPLTNQYGTIQFEMGKEYRGHNRLQYKYDEELRFSLDNDLYYYPTLNFKYPRTAGQYVDDARRKQNTSPLDGVFTMDNVYAIQLMDAVAALSDVEQVDIPILYASTECYHAYEDFLAADDSGAPNYEKYDVADPRTFQFVAFTEKQAGTAAGSQVTVDDELLKVKDDEQIADIVAQAQGVYPRRMEKTVDEDGLGYVSLRIDDRVLSQLSSDFPSMTRLYVNYSRDMALYFNYFNYLNSPYIRIEGGHVRMDTLDGTYLKLAPGEDGTLDVVVQFRYVVGNVTYGYKNARIASYRIWNVSDDKPKFVVKQTYQVQPGDLKRETPKGIVRLGIPSIDVNIDSSQAYSDENTEIEVAISVKKDCEIAAGSWFYLTYPGQLIDYFGAPVPGAQVERVSGGTLKVTVTNPSIWSVPIRFKGSDGGSRPVPLASRSVLANRFYMMAVDGYSVTDVAGEAVELESNVASVVIRSTSVVVAATENSTGTIESGDLTVVVTEESPTAAGAEFRAITLQNNVDTF